MLLNLYYQNVRGLNGKTHLIYPQTAALFFNLICFTETWAQEGLYNSEIFPADHYDVYRRDRDLDLCGKSSGGGVLIAVKRPLGARRMYGFECPGLKALWIRIDLEIPLYICCVYLPNRSVATPYQLFFKSLQDSIAQIEDDDFKILIVGDFNMASFNWRLQPDGSLLPVNYLSDDANGMNAALVHTMNCFDLLQFNQLTNASGRTLDLILCDLDPSRISCISPT